MRERERGREGERERGRGREREGEGERGGSDVHQTGEGNVLSMRNCIEVCYTGTSEPFAMQVGRNQGSAFSPFLFTTTMDTLTET